MLRDVNGSITFTCTSSVSTNVKFSWAHNGRPITRPNTQSTVGSISTLRITGIRNSDDGRYVCTVTSGLVSVTAHVKTLNVYGMIT